MIRSSIIKNAYFTSSHDGDIKKVLKDINLDVNFAEMKQIHSSEVKIINNEGIYESDGIETNAQDLPLVVRTADCMPILMQSKNLISAVHAGWRGINNSIFEKSLKNLFPLSTIELNGRYYLNLRKKIEEFCIKENIELEVFHQCTICDDNYYSYRKTTTPQRQFGIIWR